MRKQRKKSYNPKLLITGNTVFGKIHNQWA